MKIKCISISPSILVSGHFDGFHSGHLDYLKQAMEYRKKVICIVSSDKQLLMKRGKVNIPETERRDIVGTILRGLGADYSIFINKYDNGTATVTEALHHFKPSIFLRGYDKKPKTMPEAERWMCEKLSIKVLYAKNRIGERHSSEIFK